MMTKFKSLLTILIFIPINGLLVSLKYVGTDANNRLLKYGNHLDLDKNIIKRLSKGFKDDEINKRTELEYLLSKDIEYDGLVFKKGSIEHELLTSTRLAYTDEYNKQLMLYEYENKIYKYKSFDIKSLSNNPVIMNGKCAFIGFYDEGIFKPYYSFVIQKPDIRQLVIRDIPMKLSLLNERWLYLEYLLNLE